VFIFLLPNVPDEESPLASGMAPAREAESAGDMTEVPKGRGFAPSVGSVFCSSHEEELNIREPGKPYPPE
jgi:hypothetical protein